jgi:hypothetical protein
MKNAIDDAYAIINGTHLHELNQCVRRLTHSHSIATLKENTLKSITCTMQETDVQLSRNIKLNFPLK